MATVTHGRQGVDSLGKFELVRWTQCGVCGQGKRHPGKPSKNLCVLYADKPRVSPYVAKANSLLIRNKKTGNFIRTIGINCGCYAKVHRQIAHIEGGEK